MFIALDRTKCAYPADLIERFQSFLVRPAVKAFGYSLAIEGQCEQVVIQSMSKAHRIAATIFYILLCPITVPLTVLGLMITPLSRSYKEAWAKIVDRKIKENHLKNSSVCHGQAHSNDVKRELPLSKKETIPVSSPQEDLKKEIKSIVKDVQTDTNDLQSNNKSPEQRPTCITTRVPPPIVLSELPVSELKWPENLASIGIDESGKQLLESFLTTLKSVFQQKVLPPMKWQKMADANEIHLFDRIWRLPLRVFVIGTAGKRRMILNIKTRLVPSALIAKTKNRLVKLCYDPLNGEFIVKKHALNDAEIYLTGEWAGRQGIISTIAIQKIEGANGKEKTLFFEPLYQSLENFLASPIITLTVQNKLDLIKDLLTGLNFIHHFKDELIFEGRTKEETRNVDFYSFHRDLKPSNCFVMASGNTYKAMIGDLDLANSITILGGTSWYRAPEILELWERGFYNYLGQVEYHHSEPWDVIEFNREFGMPMDLWSMGIVSSEILIKNFMGYENRRSMNWMSSLKDFGTKKFPDLGLRMFNWTAQINKEIDQIQAKCREIYRNPKEIDTLIKLWEIVRKMLNLKLPKDRLTTSKALERVATLPAV